MATPLLTAVAGKPYYRPEAGSSFLSPGGNFGSGRTGLHQPPALYSQNRILLHPILESEINFALYYHGVASLSIGLLYNVKSLITICFLLTQIGINLFVTDARFANLVFTGSFGKGISFLGFAEESLQGAAIIGETSHSN